MRNLRYKAFALMMMNFRPSGTTTDALAHAGRPLAATKTQCCSSVGKNPKFRPGTAFQGPYAHISIYDPFLKILIEN